MDDKSKDLISRGELAPAEPKPGDALKHALSKLPEDKKNKLLEKALEAEISIEIKRREANREIEDSKGKLGSIAQHINEISDDIKKGSTIRIDTELLGGRYSGVFTKDNSRVIVIVAIIIGIVAVVLLND